MPNTKETEQEIKKLDTIIYTTPGIVKDEWIRVELCISVNRDWLIEYLEGEYSDKGNEQTLVSLIHEMERDLEAIKNTSYRKPLPDWFKSVECAEISEVKK
jgi:hypothetical protein